MLPIAEPLKAGPSPTGPSTVETRAGETRAGDIRAAGARPLSVLILENSDADFELFTYELRRCGFQAQCRRAETEPEYLAELKKHPDIILADYNLTGFDALRALELLHQTTLVIPVIVLTGA